LVGVDPSMTLTYRSEYKEAGIQVPDVSLIQDFLATRMLAGSVPTVLPVRRFRLFAHCTEATNAKDSLKSWQTLFALAGHQLSVEQVGCCGMAGTYGHERRHRGTSETIYTQSWAPKIADQSADQGEILATGYSCRSQVKRFSNQAIRHPISALREVLGDAAD
jgi:Fe-S oxidoreductase